MIVSIGEALIDYKNNRPFTGGCPLNVSLAASRQGAPVSFLGGISSDERGQIILQFIIDNCILFDPLFCGCTERTMTSNAVVEKGSVRYEFDWKGTSAFSVTEEKLASVFSNNTDINCVFFGSVTFTDSKASSEILSFLSKKKEVFKFFDPNIRSFLIEDKKSYLLSLEKALSISDIVKVSEEDLDYWGKTEEQLFSLCKGDLIVTKAEKGSVWYSKAFKKAFSVPAYKVENVNDTIGCGDTYSGIVLSSLNSIGYFNGKELTEAFIINTMNRASKAAALNCEKEGCNPPAADEIN